MGQVQSTDYNDGRHVTSFHIKALGIKFTKKSKKHKQQLEPDDQLENVKIKSKKRSLLSYLGKHLKLTKKKNVVKSSSRQPLSGKLGYGNEVVTNVVEYKSDYQPKSSIDDSTEELNNRLNKLNNQQIKASQPNAQLHRLPSQQIEPKVDLTSELDNELMTDIPLNSETNSLTHQTEAVNEEAVSSKQLNLNNLNNLNHNLNNLSNASQPADEQLAEAGGALSAGNKNRLSSTFSTYDLKAQLNNSTNLTNNRDQQTKLSSMLNWRSFKEQRLPESGAKGDDAPTAESNGLHALNQKNQLRPSNAINNAMNNNTMTNSLNGNLNGGLINSVVQKGAGHPSKHLLTEASNAISAISTMRNGIILTSGHPKVVDFNAIAKNNSQPTFSEPVSQANSVLPQQAQKSCHSSSQTKTIIQVSAYLSAYF